MKFKVGDKIKIIKAHPSMANLIGRTAIISKMHETVVEYDLPFDGIYCRYISKIEEVELVDPNGSQEWADIWEQNSK